MDLVPMRLHDLSRELLLAGLEWAVAGFGDAESTLDPIGYGNGWLRFAPIWGQLDRLRIIIFPL
jgi:hypothetical protein